MPDPHDLVQALHAAYAETVQWTGHVPPEQRVTFLGKTNGLLLVCCARPVPTCTVLRTIKVLTICYRACRVCVCVCVCVSLSDIT